MCGVAPTGRGRPGHRAHMKILLIPVALLVASTGVSAQGDAELLDFLQMPVAVHKAVDAGIPVADVEAVARALRRGDIGPAEFNQTMRDLAFVGAEHGDNGVTDFSAHVTKSVDDGLRGRALAESIHERLRARGIPAGGQGRRGPPPMDREFIPETVRDRAHTQGRDNSGRRDGRGNDEKDDRKNDDKGRGNR